MEFPRATRTSAFLAGASLAALAIAMSVLYESGVIGFNPDSPLGFPLMAVYFFVTGLIFVVDVRSLAPAELKTRFPGVYFPTDRAGWYFFFRVWGRMLVWFLGAASVGALGAFVQWLVKNEI
jgi:hypothetical protein